MNKEAIKKWLAALRSGDYKKCDGIMHIGNMFCAYGVLCDLHDAAFSKESKWHRYIGSDISYYYGASYIPPQVVKDWLGADLWEILQGYAPTIDLISDRAMDFNVVADEIEKKIKIYQHNFFEEA